MRLPLRPLSLLLLCGFLAAVEPTAPDSLIQLPGPVVDAAFDPATGTLGLVSTETDSLLLVPDADKPSGGKEILAIRVGRRPIAVAFQRTKRSAVFAVICRGDPTLYVIDAATRRIAGRIPLADPAPASIAAAGNADAALLYFYGNPGSRRMGAVDLDGLRDLGGTSGYDQANSGEFAADGRLVYIDQNGGGNLVARRYPAGPGGRLPVVASRSASGPRTVDPLGRWLGVGGQLLTATLEPVRVELPGRVVLFSRSRPVAFCQTETPGQLACLSTNTFRILAALDAPGIAEPELDVAQLRMFEDARGDGVLIVGTDQVARYRYSALALPREPLVDVAIDGERVATVGTPFSLSVTPRDPALTVDLIKAPPGMALANGTLTWTPGDGDVGAVDAEVRASAGGLQRTVPIRLAVCRPSIGLGFPCTGMRLDAGGALAAVIGVDPHEARNGGSQTRHVALVDLARGSVLGQRTLDLGIAGVAISGDRIFVTSHENDALLVLAGDDLAERQQVFLGSRGSDLRLIGNDLLAYGSGPGTVGFLSARTLAPVDLDAIGAGVHRRREKRRDPWNENGDPAMPVRLGSRWWFDGILYDGSLTTPLVVHQPPGVLTLLDDSPLDYPDSAALRRSAEAVPPWLLPWAARLITGSVYQGSRSVGQMLLRDAPAHAELVLEGIPAVASLIRYQTHPDGDAPTRIRTEVVFQSLADAGMAERWTVADESVEDAFLSYTTPGLVEAGDRLVACIADRVYALRSKLPEAARLRPVLSLERALAVALISERNTAVALPAVATSRPPAVCDLVYPVRWARLDAGSRRLVIDPAGLRKALGPHLATIFTRSDGTPSALLDPATRLAEYIARSAPLAERLTGTAPRGTPIWVRLKLAVRDSSLQAIEHEVGFFFDLPTDDVRAILAEWARTVAAEAAKGDAGNDPTVKRLLESQEQLKKRIDQLENELKARPATPAP